MKWWDMDGGYVERDDDEASRVLVVLTTKSCPKCSRKIEKDGGCPHMTCVGCKYEVSRAVELSMRARRLTCPRSLSRSQFCWRCMGPYPNCPCQTDLTKLSAERAAEIKAEWERTNPSKRANFEELNKACANHILAKRVAAQIGQRCAAELRQATSFRLSPNRIALFEGIRGVRAAAMAARVLCARLLTDGVAPRAATC
jgi:hypothetical protein